MTALDWRKHTTGPLRPCIHCGRPAFMRDADSRPCHKVCAETRHTPESESEFWEVDAA